ncbi:MAG: enoyl-CoA hydratase/isomerase family protein [Comamonadaceae bacterium]|nr:enoyl-CoA hydratase/isomerase family protein [Comamonadaceae bacterium]
MTVSLNFSHEGAVATVSLARPEARNALNYAMLEQVSDAFRVADSRGARIIVLRADGPSFCAGADRKAYPGFSSGESNEALAQHAINIGNRVTQTIASTNALTIAQVHGHAVGGGLVLAMCCDMRFTADDARLSLPELSLGLPLAWGALYRLIGMVGTTKAWDMLASMEILSGSEAAQIGLCSAAVPAAELPGLVSRKIEGFLKINPQALFLTKRQFRAISAKASFGNLEDLDGSLLLGPLRANTFDNAFETP